MYLKKTDYGPAPFVGNVRQMALDNHNFRTAVWTGEHLQLTLMDIPICGEIGLEMHEDTDQMIRVEYGQAKVMMGREESSLNLQANLNTGDAVFVPAGTWHNIINTGRSPLKLSSVYAPPHHKHGTVHRTKEEAARKE